MTGATARLGTAVLGTALVVYAITGLAAWRLAVPILSPLVGAITGMITAATGESL